MPFLMSVPAPLDIRHWSAEIAIASEAVSAALGPIASGGSHSLHMGNDRQRAFMAQGLERDGAPGLDPVQEATRGYKYLHGLGWGTAA